MPRKPHHSSNYGGRRPGAGRPVSSGNRYSKELVARAHEGGEHPFDYMLKIMRDETQPQKERMYAAACALPYCAARLQTVDLKVESEISGLSMAEKVALAESLRHRILEHDPKSTVPQLPVIEGETVNVE